MSELNNIARKYDTDKAEHPHYLKNYEDFFGHLVAQPVRLLELGIKKGGSLLLWRDYFPQGVIVGLDLDPVQLDDSSGRIFTYQGAQEDTALLDRIAQERAPDGFDVIIDDCAHIGVLARISFWHLFEHHLKSGGIYVIEDWGTGYWASWPDGVGYKPRGRAHSPARFRLLEFIARLQRSRPAGYLPGVTKLLVNAKALLLRRDFHSHDYGMVGFVKELIDELAMRDITHPQSGAALTQDSKIRELAFWHSHLFVIKA
jgi:hypothetical protein